MNEHGSLKAVCTDGLNGVKQHISYPSDNPTIWKFVDISTFLTILTDSCLFFSSINNLCAGDPFECALWPNQRYKGWTRDQFIEKALSLSYVLPRPAVFADQISQLKKFEDFLSKANESTLVKTISWLELELSRRRIICNCWHENTCESDAMWKIYSARTGVAIKSNAESLAQSVVGYMAPTYQVPQIEYYMKEIYYCDEDQLPDVPEFYVRHPWMLKRSGFKHEDEMRVFSQAPEQTPVGAGIHIKVNLGRLVDQVILSPFNPEYVNDGIRKVVEKLQAGLAGQVTQSEHMRKPPITNPFLRDRENEEGIKHSCQSMEFLLRNKLLF